MATAMRAGKPGPLAGAQNVAVREGWADAPLAPALYVSAGDDPKALTFTHPAFFSRQYGRELGGPSFYVFVDESEYLDGSHLEFDDGRTRTRILDRRAFDVHGFPGELLCLQFESNELADRRVAILRLRARNDDFAQAAEEEGWHPHLFIGMCDGCGGFGGNDRCENQLADPAISIPLRLGAIWWITDHFCPWDRYGRLDPHNGDEIQPASPDFPASLRQVAFLSTKWRSYVPGNWDGRLYGGARLFEVQRQDHISLGDFARRDALYSPRALRKLESYE